MIIAIDFDNTLCFSKWPDCGPPNEPMINYIKDRIKSGDNVILWTCRCGEQLEEAVKWCSEKGITFDCVNENLPMMVEKFGNNPRKIYADIYIDDKSDIPGNYEHYNSRVLTRQKLSRR